MRILLESKTNRIVLFVSAFFVIALILFAVLRDNAEPVTLKKAVELLDNKSVKSVIATKEYVYFKNRQ